MGNERAPTITTAPPSTRDDQFDSVTTRAGGPPVPRADVDKLAGTPASQLVTPTPAPDENLEPTRAQWSWKRLPAPGMEKHRYGTPETLAVGDRLEIRVTTPDPRAELDTRTDGVTVKNEATAHHGREWRLLYSAQRAGKGAIYSSVADPEHASAAHVHHVRVINTVVGQQGRVMTARNEVEQQYTAAAGWLHGAAAAYTEAYTSHKKVLEAASRGSTSLVGDLLWAAFTSVVGLAAKDAVMKLFAGGHLTDKGSDHVGEAVKDGIGGAPRPEGPGARTEPAGAEPGALFHRAAELLEGKKLRLLKIERRLLEEIDETQRGGQGPHAEFDTEPLQAIREDTAITAELAGELQALNGTPPSATVFEVALWQTWLREHAWKVVPDGTTNRRVRLTDREFTEVRYEFKAAEDLPAGVVNHIASLGIPEGREFLRTNASVAEGRARAQAAELERNTPTVHLGEKRQ